MNDIAHGSITSRLQNATSELRDLEQALQHQAVDPRVLSDFREAVNHARRTAWAVQQWLESRDKKGDTFTVHSILAIERVRVTAELAKNVTLDLDAFEITIETEGLNTLIAAIRNLHERLARLRQC